MNTQTIALDLSKDLLHVSPVRIGQGDKSGTVIRAELFDNGLALDTTGLEAYFVMELPDGEHYYREEATLAANVATVTVDEQHAAIAVGLTHNAYFQLLQGTTVIASTSRFPVQVLRSAIDGMELAPNYDGLIERRINDADVAIGNANSATSRANTAAAAAEGKAEEADAAADAATDAAANANEAAEEARGAVPPTLSTYLGWETDEDGEQYMVIIDTSD